MAVDERWRRAAWDLFGYRLMGETNHDEIADALEQVWNLLADRRDVQITVRERVEDADVIDGNATRAVALPAP